jgi:long-chain acyl-CoA synthetase
MLDRGIRNIALAEPQRPAIVFGDRRIPFGELERLINQRSHMLRALNVAAGARVAVMLTNRPEVFETWNAVTRLGGVVVPISYRFTPTEVAQILEDSAASVFVHEDHEAADRAIAQISDPPAMLHVSDPEVLTQPSEPPVEDFLGAIGLPMMYYTSGTTGRPKGLARAAPEPSRITPEQPFFRFWGFGAEDSYLLTGPAYHAAPGAYAQQHLVEGGRVVIMDHFDAIEFLTLVQDERITNSHMVPANFIRILEVDWSNFDLSSIRKIIHGAAPCPPSVKRQIMDVFPAGTVWEYYGMSEGMGTIISPEEWLEKPGSVGRPFPGLEVRIIDDQGSQLPSGEVGLIYVSVFPGFGFKYHNAPEKTAASYRGEFFTVGDVGILDDDGYLYIADRRVDLIIRGGVNIYAAEVEGVLIEHPDVVDCAVFGLPDDRLGQQVHAVVECRSGAVFDEEPVLEFMAGRLAAYKLPRTFEVVDELPREPNGKILKHRLRHERLLHHDPVQRDEPVERH